MCQLLIIFVGFKLKPLLFQLNLCKTKHHTLVNADAWISHSLGLGALHNSNEMYLVACSVVAFNSC